MPLPRETVSPEGAELAEQDCAAAESALRSHRLTWLRVLGGSMWPWIRSGDLLLVRREDPTTIPSGAVVFLARDGRLFAHRLIRKGRVGGRSVLVTRGDALPANDPPFLVTELLGRAVRILRGRRQINLEGWALRMLGRVNSKLSAWNRLYPIARIARRLLLSPYASLLRVKKPKRC